MSLRMKSPLPSLEGVNLWLQGEPSSGHLLGKPVLVHFWSLSCYLCHDTAEQVAQWRDSYAPKGLQVIAVHQPRSPEELDPEKVVADLGPMHITHSCAVDNDHTIVDRFQNTVVPGFYLFDRAHHMRHFQAGGQGLDRMKAAIERVLAEDAPAS